MYVGGGSLSLPFFQSSPVPSESLVSRTSSNKFPCFPVRIGSRCHRGAEGVQEIRGKAAVASPLGNQMTLFKVIM